jgi:hypothetical protein
MLENISEHALKFQANALRHVDILPDAEVHIPVGQANKIAIAAVPGI